jgi:hypothetical protein
VRKLYSSSTRFRPPLIPDYTRNHPSAMSSRNTSIRFAQFLTFGNVANLDAAQCQQPIAKANMTSPWPHVPSDLVRWCTIGCLTLCPNERETYVVMVGNQAHLMKVTNLDTRLIQTKTFI